MRIGLYSITYRGVWYDGEAIDMIEMMDMVKKEGWEGIEFDTERPHLAPMDLTGEERKALKNHSVDIDLPICSVSPSCEISSPVPIYREAMICYVRECIKLAHDLGAPICKIFAAWRGVTLYNGLATYNDTYGTDPYPYWKSDRRDFAVASLRELSQVAEDYGVTLALQNHGPDIIKSYKDVLSLIKEVGSSSFKACIDLCNEEKPGIESDQYARSIVKESGELMVHSHFNGEFTRNQDGEIIPAYDDFFGDRKPAYPAYVEALVESGYDGFMNWEFCHPAKKDGSPADIDYVQGQTRLALEYMKKLRAKARTKVS